MRVDQRLIRITQLLIREGVSHPGLDMALNELTLLIAEARKEGQSEQSDQEGEGEEKQ